MNQDQKTARNAYYEAGETHTATIEVHMVLEDGICGALDLLTVSNRHAHVLGGYLRDCFGGDEIAPENFGTMKLTGLDAVYFDFDRTDLPMMVQHALCDLKDLRDETGLNRELSTLQFRTN